MKFVCQDSLRLFKLPALPWLSVDVKTQEKGGEKKGRIGLRLEMEKSTHTRTQSRLNSREKKAYTTVSGYEREREPRQGHYSLELHPKPANPKNGARATARGPSLASAPPSSEKPDKNRLGAFFFCLAQ